MSVPHNNEANYSSAVADLLGDASWKSLERREVPEHETCPMIRAFRE